MTSPVLRAMDLSDGGEIAVEGNRDLVTLVDTTMFPFKRIYLTVTEARKLAEFLTEQADAAEAYDA